jgi:hypothetical protein
MKKIKLLLIACFAACLATAQVPDFAWAKKLESFSAAPMAVDAAGNCYMAGFYFGGPLTLGPGVTLPYNGPNPTSECYVAKFSPVGDVIWGKRILNTAGLSNDKNIDKILVDNAGNVYITGMFTTAATIDNVPLPVVANYHYDYFLAKLDGVTGAVQWIKTAPVTGVVMTGKFPNTIRFNKAGNICMTGLYGATVAFDASYTLANADSSSMLNAFVTTYDTSGNVLRAINLGSEIVYNANNLSYDELFKLDKDDHIYRLITTTGKIIKYDTNGTPVMTKVVTATGAAFVITAMEVDRNGNIFLGSWIYGGNVTIEGTSVIKYAQNNFTDAVLIKLNTTGTMQWLRQYQYAVNDAYTLLRADDIGNIYGIGQHGTIGEGRSLFVKYAGNGTLLWDQVIAPMPAQPNEPTAVVNALNVVPVGGGNALVLGRFTERLYFNATTSFRTTSGINEYKTFLAKYGSCNLGAPAITTTPAATAFCMGDTVQLSSAIATAYQWSTGDTTRNIKVATPGNYSVYAIDGAACYARSSPVPVTFVPFPDTSVSVSGPVLTANQGGASYQWVNCDGYLPVPGATGQTFTAVTGGNYALIIRNSTGCTDTSACHTVVTTGVTGISQHNVMALYPNPGHTTLHIETKAPVHSVTIINQLGQPVMVSHSQHINIAPIATGVYYVIVVTDAGTSTLRWMKQ